VTHSQSSPKEEQPLDKQHASNLDTKRIEVTSQFLESIRGNFPRVECDANGRRRIFFDNGAGSLVLGRAVEAEAKARLDYSANTGESSWESKMNEQVMAQGREAVSDFLAAPSGDCIFAGESASDMLFHLSYAISKEMKRDENIVLTEYEHYSNITPWTELENRKIVREVRFARFDPENGILDLSHLASLIDRKTRVVSVTGIANALGTRTPVGEVFKLAREVDAFAVLDAVHMVPHVPIDVTKLNCDFAVFSGYKLYAGRGSYMYGKRELLEAMKPYRVDPNPDIPPHKWELGTQDQARFAAVTAVVDYLSWLGSEVEKEVRDRISEYAGRRRLLKAAMVWIEEYEKSLSVAMLGGTGKAVGMPAIRGVETYGLKDPGRADLRAPTFSFNIAGADPYEVAEYLWEKHAIVLLAENGGGFYSKALRTYGKSVGVRASLVHYNTVDEVEAFLTALAETAKHFTAP
jgi:selenocysteine lyase/cysteine desulfurase